MSRTSNPYPQNGQGSIDIYFVPDGGWVRVVFLMISKYDKYELIVYNRLLAACNPRKGAFSVMRKHGAASRNILFLCSQIMLSQLICLPQSGAQEILPRPEQPFRGKIDRTVRNSIPDFPKAVTALKDAPNILIIMTDDVGFGASSTFGGPISTPTFDRLAANGLRYTQFHTTALSSPTRAALLTGRNHHTAAPASSWNRGPVTPVTTL